MSSLRYNQQSMNGLESITDGISILEDGVLTCVGVVSDYVTSIDVNVNNSITAGQSMAIGKDVAIGNSVVCPNLFTTKLVSNSLECNKLKVEKIHLYNNLISYDDTNVGYIKKSPIIPSFPLLTTNTNKSVMSLALPIGVYMINYSFDIALSAISLPVLHSITSVLSTDNIFADILLKQDYQSIEFNNILSNVTINETVFHQVKNYNSSVYLLALHNNTVNQVSSVLLQNVTLSALRIA